MGNDQKIFKTLYDKERRKIDTRLQNALKNRQPASLYEPGAYIINSKGKRLRPLLVLLSAKAVGGNFKQVYNAAVAVELLHNFTLVHDDIMDHADKRRGRLTLHKKYDPNTAILTGDSLLSVAYEYLLKDCNSNAKNVIQSFTHGLVEVCEGQSMDTDFESNITADENVFGKSIGGDLVEGKKTYLFLKALENAKGEDKRILKKVIDNEGISWKQVKKYKELYIKLGVLNQAGKAIKSYTNRAKSSLKILNDENQKVFYWLADALIKRTR
jgi:geranylgeranyl diphosphate synthase type II